MLKPMPAHNVPRPTLFAHLSNQLALCFLEGGGGGGGGESHRRTNNTTLMFCIMSSQIRDQHTPVVHTK